MNHKNIKLIPNANHRNGDAPDKLTYWRSTHDCFSIDYKGIITEICKGDLGYGDMDRLDGAIHAAIGCKQKESKDCKLRKV
jgi:hypothetical protein